MSDIQGFFIPTDTEQEFTAIITSSLSNIESPDIEKRIDYIDINFVGDGIFSIYDEDYALIQDFILSGLEEPAGTLKRNTERLYVKLNNRTPIEKMQYKITTTDKKFILYDINIEFETTEKDGGFSAIPKNQAST